MQNVPILWTFYFFILKTRSREKNAGHTIYSRASWGTYKEGKALSVNELGLRLRRTYVASFLFHYKISSKILELSKVFCPFPFSYFWII